MKFEIEISSWIDEIQNYLTDSSLKIGKLKKVLSEVDFSNLDYASKSRLAKMFDPTKEISEKLFKREVDLYFSLLENNPRAINLPIFSEYMDWLYKKDSASMSDEMFEIMAMRALKSNAKEIPSAVYSFLQKLPHEFESKIDNISNLRLNTLVGILNLYGKDYEQLPKECKEFIKKMFISCAVKTEIADKNKQKFRNLFREDPKRYYSIFNSAFAGVGAFETWIDEPAKKLTFKNMVNYANFQSKVLEKSMYNLRYQDLERTAKQLSLPKLPPYNEKANGFGETYLKEPREYKNYAKKMVDLFVGLVRSELSEIEKLGAGNKFPFEKFDEFAVTSDMIRLSGLLKSPRITEKSLNNYADFLISVVHLDELTGLSKKDIYNAERTQKNVEQGLNKQAKNIDETNMEQKAQQQKKDIHGTFEFDADVIQRIKNNCCDIDDLPELYEIYNLLVGIGKRDFDLEGMIFDLQVKAEEMKNIEQENEF